MLSSSQRPRAAAPSAGVDKRKQGPLAWKFHDISLKDWTGGAKNKPNRQPAANCPKLQTGTGVGTLDTAVENVEIESADVVLATADTSDILPVSATPTDTFCPKITSIVSLENIK